MTTKTPHYSDPVKLSPKITRGSDKGDNKAQRIDAVRVRRPRSGELRGLSLSELLIMNTDQMLTLLPRITEPALTEPELSDLDPSCLLDLSFEVLDFLGSKKLSPNP
ncbi:MAG: phage tail assembly protein [Gammaproteobacteria bacterium]|nr:phage tail assembly protein [Gammaproteobacteria bacterium]